MKVINPIDDILDNNNKVRLLRHLTLYPSDVATGRSLARDLGMNHATCINALNSLHRAGIVNRRRTGSSTLYQVARETEVYKQLLQPLFEKETGLIGGVAATLTSGLGESVLEVLLFGSAAREESVPESDTDILLIINDETDKDRARETLSQNILDAYKKYHTGFNVILYTRSEFEAEKKRGGAFLKEALSDSIPLSSGEEHG